MITINLDDIPTEKMTAKLYAYLMESHCAAYSKELPLGDTGFSATWEGRHLNKNTLIRILDNTIYFLGGNILSGYYVKKYHLEN